VDTNSEIFKHIELLFGSIGVILGLFFSVFLLVTKKNQPLANSFLAIYLLAFSLRIGKSLFFNYFPIDPVIRNVFLGVLLAIGPSLWFYTKLRYNPKENVSATKVLWHYLPMFLVIAFCWLIPNDSSPLARFFYISYIVHIVLYTAYALYWLNRQVKRSAASGKLKITTWLNAFLIVTLVIVGIYFLISIRVIPYYLGMAFFFSLVILFFSGWALRNPYLFKVEIAKYSNSNLTLDTASVLVERLEALMNSEKLYLNPDLTLAKVSKELNVQSKQLSQAINQVKDVNYSQYITNFRIEEAKLLLSSETHKNHKIAAIAYDSGFNSLSSFNAAFKKLTKQTAAQYRKQNLEH
jgi:AraC-like DNA-binding protein